MMPMEHSSSSIGTRASWSQTRVINIYRREDLGAEKSVICLGIQLARDRASKRGSSCVPLTARSFPLGTGSDHCTHHMQWEHLSTHTVKYILLFRSPAKLSLSVKPGSITLHSMAVK